MTGASRSVPSSDHVPELRNADVPPANTEATADPVSWQAGATTGVPASAALTSLLTCPTIVPGSTSAGSRRLGISSSCSSPVAQVRVFASTNWVVVAIVYSAASSPVIQ